MITADDHGSEADRIVERVLADPPIVHLMDSVGTLGVWDTEPECYRFIAARCASGSRTLETGAGISTIVMCSLGAHHEAVTPLQDEVDRLLDYCRGHSVSVEHLRFHVGRSEQVLPGLQSHELDLVFLDGNHGFPVPMIDFFYSAGRLRHGGTLVLDDLQLPVVRLLADFCDLDPRWRRLRRNAKWGAWERQSSGPLEDDHYHQAFLVEGWLPRRGRRIGPLRRVAGRLVRAARGAG